jgi:hypothetical protein
VENGYNLSTLSTLKVENFPQLSTAKVEKLLPFCNQIPPTIMEKVALSAWRLKGAGSCVL